MGTVRRFVLPLLAAWCVAGAAAAQAANPWDNDPAVQEVLKIRQQAIRGDDDDRTDPGERALLVDVRCEYARRRRASMANRCERRSPRAAVKYAAVEMKLDYAGSHGKDVVVLMGEEIVVPGAGARNAGERIRRRFTGYLPQGERRVASRRAPLERHSRDSVNAGLQRNSGGNRKSLMFASSWIPALLIA